MLEGQGHCGPSWEWREANKKEGEAVGERKERQATAVQCHIALKKKKDLEASIYLQWERELPDKYMSAGMRVGVGLNMDGGRHRNGRGCRHHRRWRHGAAVHVLIRRRRTGEGPQMSKLPVLM